MTTRTERPYTPWGRADHAEEVGRGVLRVSTPSHGGLYVPAELLHRVTPEGRAYAKEWSGSEQWYEEDCARAHVAVAFPELFPDDQDAARATLARLAEWRAMEAGRA